MFITCTNNKLQRAEREQFGGKNTDQEPAGGGRFVILFHVAQVAIGTDVAAADESTAFDFDRHTAGRDGKVEVPFPCRMETIFRHHL